MPDAYSSLILPDVRLMVQEEDRHGLSEFNKVLHPVVIATILDELQPREVWVVLDNASLRRRVEIFDTLPYGDRLNLSLNLTSAGFQNFWKKCRQMTESTCCLECRMIELRICCR